MGSAIRAATRVGARVFVVIAGPGGAEQRARLAQLAGATGGEVLKVGSIGELRAAFAALARTLSRQYLLSYVSNVGPGQPVRVNLRIDNARATTSYATPGTPAPPSGPSFWFTTQGAAVFVLVLLAIPAVLVTGFMVVRRGRRRSAMNWRPGARR